MDDKKIFEEMVNILKVYTKDTTLLEKATLDTHILNDLKVNSARLVDVIIKCEDVSVSASMTTRPIRSAPSAMWSAS